jgi:transcriptional regulator NrdR family protein
MKCPECYHDHSKVIESVPSPDGFSRWRVHRCYSCLHEWTTHEVPDDPPMPVASMEVARRAK